jgi:two-component system nitrogen regulation response regulator NtrX
MAKLVRSPAQCGRILLVDDEEMVRKAIRLILGFSGYEIVEAVDGEEAVHKYLEASPPFDLIVIDLDMPRLNGAEAMARIRNHHPEAKAILLSGGVHAVDLERIHFLQKPFEIQQLIGLVRESLQVA